MTPVHFLSCIVILAGPTAAQSPLNASDPIVNPAVVFAEDNGLVAVEAEHFFEQTRSDTRAFHLTTADQSPPVQPDGDAAHVAGASGGAYLEILPDTRRDHSDPLVRGENFSPQPGKLAILKYKVHFKTTGRYYVWARAYSTGSEDNGLHVGVDGTWPETGQRMQWCQGKRTWRWESKQRTEQEHCGEPHKIYLDIQTPGEHVIQFSMREDGFEFDKWFMTTRRDFKRPDDTGPPAKVFRGKLPEPFPFIAARVAANTIETEATAQAPSTRQGSTSPTTPLSDQPRIEPRQVDGDGSIQITGERKVWHKVTFSLNGPFAHEQDNEPNPFTDYALSITFRQEGLPPLRVPGYFAADGDAANSSAESGTIWRAHFSPPTPGVWKYDLTLVRAPQVALAAPGTQPQNIQLIHHVTGTLEVAPSDKSGRDLRAHGQLRYVGKHYLQFAGSEQYFLKIGADAPETLLAYSDFDNTIAGNPKKAPLKTWAPHVHDWREGDPTWKGDRGKGLIGAINYLSSKGCNAFSFLTYNAGGDGDNVWPFIHRDDKLHYDCSKLDQWGIVFDHGTRMGMYLHFKMQETEIDDHRKHNSKKSTVPESLDGGDLGMQRKLYCRELIARYSHNLALNWNLGEENTQTTAQQNAMIDYIAELDPYDHNIVVHTFPEQQDKVYRPLLGDRSRLTGVSLQNSHISTTHAQALKWVKTSQQAGKAWVVAFDESGSAAHGQCPDLGYRGFDGRDRTGKMIYTEHEVRKQTLWGTLMAGGAGCEYYFGYQFAENDIVCQDWRSRDRSWDYGRHAIEFFHHHRIPFWEMTNQNSLVGNPENHNRQYCFAKTDQLYLVYLPHGGSTKIDLTAAQGEFRVRWYNPRTGGQLQQGSTRQLQGGTSVSIGQPPADHELDWLAVIRKENAR